MLQVTIPTLVTMLLREQTVAMLQRADLLFDLHEVSLQLFARITLKLGLLAVPGRLALEKVYLRMRILQILSEIVCTMLHLQSSRSLLTELVLQAPIPPRARPAEAQPHESQTQPRRLLEQPHRLRPEACAQASEPVLAPH